MDTNQARQEGRGERLLREGKGIAESCKIENAGAAKSPVRGSPWGHVMEWELLNGGKPSGVRGQGPPQA